MINDDQQIHVLVYNKGCTMFRTKLDYLYKENIELRKENTMLKNMLADHSAENEKSLLYQLREENDRLHESVSKMGDELLLEKEVREIENADYQQDIREYNEVIFKMKEYIGNLQNILKQEQKIQYEVGGFHNWIKQKFQGNKNKIFHTYSDPVLMFNILEQALQSHDQEQERNEPFDIDNKQELSYLETTCFKKDSSPEKKQSKWFQQESQIYFLKKKRNQNLRIQLRRAKIMQMNLNNSTNKSQQQPMGDHKLLKKSYVDLILEFQKQRKKLMLYQKYIQQLQSRNQLLIYSKIGTSQIL